MKRDRLEAWLRNIYVTQDVEISCTECFDLISTVVEVELSGRHGSAELPGVKQHLDQCRACRDEYESLIDISCMEADSDLPSLQTLQDRIR